ncbi:alpha/beta fold hydrolase [Pseudomonas sp. M30-35]|uniref:alpha/beta fold hydrolase n=1 Tax=Pseudomonas sp. M30-35 TaxID=1981174 RepID=UPI000B3CBD3C|nr:alpha/beta fold hydrolase [Pseudomonas sp. M30-35]ARU89959.1 alpha/beta hydrolase [Pseudomonas sp. M30-35]
MNKEQALISSTTSQTYHWRDVAGLKIFYREAGPADGPAVVLLHGYPSTSKMYTPLIPLLAAAGYHVIAPDYPGFGLSDAPTPAQYSYTFENIARTMNQLLSELGMENYALFMQDYGGPVGFRMAMANSKAVNAIIVQNGNAYEEGLGAKWGTLFKYWQDPEAHPEVMDAFVSFKSVRQRHLGNSPNPQRYNPEAWHEEFAMLSRPGSRAIQSTLFYDYQNNVKSYPVWQKWMREHQPPALILWGKYDPSFIVPGAKAFKRDLPDAELHILDAGHFALEEANEEIAELVIDFLAREVKKPKEQ